MIEPIRPEIIERLEFYSKDTLANSMKDTVTYIAILQMAEKMNEMIAELNKK